MKTSILLKTHILWSSLLWKRYNSLKWHFPKWQEKEIRENRLESAERASCLVRSVSFEYKGQAPETQLTWTHSILGHFTLLINHLCYVRFHCRCHPCYQWDAFVKGKFVLLIFNRIPQELIFNLGPCVCVKTLCCACIAVRNSGLLSDSELHKNWAYYAWIIPEITASVWLYWSAIM